MKLVFLVLAIVGGLSCISCERKKDISSSVESSTTGFNTILFNIRNTSIKGGRADSIEQLRKRFERINIDGTESFWPDHEMFFMHAMGNLEFPESGEYTFRLTSRGKVIFRLNNVDISNISMPKDTVTQHERYVEKGKNIFEFEYFDGGLNPKIVLEWSRDGEKFEIVPDSAFSVIEQEVGQGSTALQDSVYETDLNKLTDQEKKEGWKLLFDGQSTAGWHRYNTPGIIGSKWYAKDGALTFEGRDRFRYIIEGRMIEVGDTDKKSDGGIDIVTDESFGDFELKLEWKISMGGNSGIFYTVQEDPKYDEAWKTSPEMQILDDFAHKDGLIYKHRSGDLYDLIASSQVTVKPQGNWNSVKIIKKKGTVEHWLNAVKVVEYNINSDDWTNLIRASKFSELNDFAMSNVNKIGLQDHDNQVSFRNIKIRELK